MSVMIWIMFQVIMIDIFLSGDNAVVIGMSANGLPKKLRNLALIYGMSGAMILRVLLSLLAVSLMALHIVALIGGIGLLWVAWGMWRDIVGGEDVAQDIVARKSLGRAAMAITIADISMSMDNVLAVAGAARGHPIIMTLGLLLSITIMGFAAKIVSELIERHPWMKYLGLVMIVYVAIRLIVTNLNFF